MKSVFIHRRVVVNSYRPKPSPPKGGCASVIILVFICLLAACTSLTSAPDSLGITYEQKERISGDANSDTHAKKDSTQTLGQSLCIVVWVDKSYSVMGTVPKVKKEHILELLDLIDEIGSGSISLGIIGQNTVSDMIFYNRLSEFLKPPIREHGMSSTEYQKRLLAYKKKKERGADSKDNLAKRMRFEKALDEYLDYSVLHASSKICEGINISKQIFKQSNNQAADKILLAVTDGLDNGNSTCAWSLGKNVDMIVVNRLTYDAFPRYPNEKYVDIEIAIDQITNKY